jgi:hypothetical protein
MRSKCSFEFQIPTEAFNSLAQRCPCPDSFKWEIPMLRKSLLRLERLEDREAPSGLDPTDPNSTPPPPPPDTTGYVAPPTPTPGTGG